MRNRAAAAFGRSLRRGKPSLFWALAVTVLYGGGHGGYWNLVAAVKNERRR